MKALIFKYKNQSDIYYGEGYDEESVRKALESKIKIGLSPGKNPSRNELKGLWSGKLSLDIRKEDIYTDRDIKNMELKYRLKFWIGRLHSRDDVQIVNGKEKRVEYLSKERDTVAKYMFKEGLLIPNVGFNIAITNQAAVDKNLYMFNSVDDCYLSLKELMTNAGIENDIAIEGTDITYLDILNAAVL